MKLTIAEAARREAAQTSIANWRDQFLDGGQQAVAAGGPTKPTTREQHLAAECEQLAAVLGEAHMELRLWRKGGALYPASTSSTPITSMPMATDAGFVCDAWIIGGPPFSTWMVVR